MTVCRFSNGKIFSAGKTYAGKKFPFWSGTYCENTKIPIGLIGFFLATYNFWRFMAKGITQFHSLRKNARSKLKKQPGILIIESSQYADRDQQAELTRWGLRS
jgi:hypothetical protein